ncbi:MAG TPA: xanthine dehydrogenase family protein molybdopterin-binding subunit [Acidobacteriaceae bacterium]|jgi:xanthine dehydrogenase YagR molybdenum-binding subunit|nr:xanthine dehydrogenase family protein molybdopterin-binding subunit [Acidobacteriaceae bacterium]
MLSYLFEPDDTTPAQPETAAYTPSSIIGSALGRIDGPLKTTGRAAYAMDYNFPHTAHAVAVSSTVANGTIRGVDTSKAEKMPGVVLLLTHENINATLRVPEGVRAGRNSETRGPLEDNTVGYWGQYVALVVAETLQQAQAAAAAIRVDYDAKKPNVSTVLDDAQVVNQRVNSKRGDSEAAFATAPVKIDETYVTPVETHNPMEMHATTAVWDGSRFTLYESSQGVVNHLNVMSAVLAVPKENIQVISRFMGSGFGGKLFPWPHSALAATASRRLNRPVKLSVTRKQMFTSVGHRPRTQQRVRLGATPDGKLVSLQHDYRNSTSLGDNIGENCGEATPFLYSTPNLQVTSALVKRNVGAPTPMRGPGAVPGLFAMESAMDELALALKMDPVELRVRNDTLTDESTNKPFSSRHYKECLQAGAEKFGWSKRTPGVGSMRKGDLILGWGVAGASWGAGRGGANAAVSLKSDGTARVSSATQDIGTGTYTVMAQIVSDRTGIPVGKIDVVLGDSSLPVGPTSGGSTATASIVPAVAQGTDAAVKSLLAIATQTSSSPFYQQDSGSLKLTEGRVHASGKPAASGIPFAEILKAAKADDAKGEGHTGGIGSDTRARDYSMHSFGAQFVEVEWDPGIARLRVSRVVSVMDTGRTINLKTAANQISGGVVMGVGMALLEHTVYDQRNGHPINDSFADYLVATNADAPQIEVHFLNIPDPMIGEYGARGVGEIGLAGVAPAITAAVYHATGVRVRTLPVRIEDLLTATV